MVSITDSARIKIAKLCMEHQQSVRLAIESGGCNGFSKVWNFTDDIHSDDVIFHCDTGVLVIDSVSLDIISGAEIDYQDDLSGAFFTIKVPAAKSSCGCGISFSI